VRSQCASGGKHGGKIFRGDQGGSAEIIRGSLLRECRWDFTRART
jgi:hypothetical protein